MNGINHLFTAPYHPQSNGQAERFVDTVKRALMKIDGGEKTSVKLLTFLLNYRSTSNPNIPNGKSPAEAMFNRNIRTTFELLRPPKEEENHRNTQMEQQFNKKHGAKERSFSPKDLVFVLVHQNNKTHWEAGEVIERRGTVMYNIRMKNKTTIIRVHVNQLRKRLEHPDENDQGNGKLNTEMLLATDTLPQEHSENNNSKQHSTPSRRVQPGRRAKSRRGGVGNAINE